MITITLHGSYEARCDAYGLHQRAKRHGVVDVLARRLIASGVDPNMRTEVVRDGTVCFDVVPLQVWAERRLTEHDVHGFSRRKYVPRPDDLEYG